MALKPGTGQSSTVSPLKLTDVNHPNATNILNKWADTQSKTVADQSAQIKSLQQQITDLQKSGSSSSSSSSSSKSSSSGGGTKDVTSSRAFGTSYQNTGSTTMIVCGWALTHGSSVGEIVAKTGSGSPTLTVFKNENTASVEGAAAFFMFPVPAGQYYTVTTSGDVYSVGGWTETNL